MHNIKNNNENNNIPIAFTCPITHMLFEDPVIDNEGNSYEKKAIEDWLKRNQTSPITRNPLSINDLKPNRGLKDAILEWKNSKNKKSDSKEVDFEIKNRTDNSKFVASEMINFNDNLTQLYLEIRKLKDTKDDRNRFDIVTILDISGSTSEGVKNSFGESDGLNILNLITHSTKTISQVLNSGDRLGCITYSSNHNIIRKLENKTHIDGGPMTEKSKKQFCEIIDRLTPKYQTNFWAGLNCGLDMIRNRVDKSRIPIIFFLTDGVPTPGMPPQGNIKMLKKYMEKYGFICPIHTFGFGYDLNSNILYDIATLTDGTYSFIPDGTFVGTIFINKISSLLTTDIDRIKLEILLSNETVIDELSLDYPYNIYELEDCLKIVTYIGSLQSDQLRSFNILIKSKNKINSLKYKLQLFNNEDKDKANYELHFKISINEKDKMRFEMLNLLKELTKLSWNPEKVNYTDIQSKINILINIFDFKLKNLEDKSNKDYITGLKEDLEGEVTKAFKNEKDYTKWGRHYIPALYHSHLFQVCSNFKDPGLQFYGGEKFNIIRDVADDIFNNLPPPKPTNPKPNYRGGAVYRSLSLNNDNSLMRSYNNSGGGCIVGECNVLMNDKTLKLVKDIRKGDKIFVSENIFATVLCCVKTRINYGSKYKISKFDSGLMITPWHPVKINNEWKFPEMLFESEYSDVKEVFNFVLDKHHIMIINNIECVTLGHGITDNEVVNHEFFGTNKVINCLKNFNGYNDGFVELTNEMFIKNPKTNKIGTISKYILNINEFGKELLRLHL